VVLSCSNGDENDVDEVRNAEERSPFTQRRELGGMDKPEDEKGMRETLSIAVSSSSGSLASLADYT